MVVVARSLGTLALCVVPTHILWTGSNRNNKDEQNSGNSSAQKLETSSMVMFNYFSSLFRVNGIHANYVYLFGEYSLEEVESRYFFSVVVASVGLDWINIQHNPCILCRWQSWFFFIVLFARIILPHFVSWGIYLCFSYFLYEWIAVIIA